MIIKYTVRDRYQEFDCEECGEPVFLNEVAYELRDLNVFVCSKHCAKLAVARADNEIKVGGTD